MIHRVLYFIFVSCVNHLGYFEFIIMTLIVTRSVLRSAAERSEVTCCWISFVVECVCVCVHSDTH